MKGIGTTITFASGFFAEISDMSPPGPSRESISTSHFGTTGAMTFEPASLVDWGEMTVEIAFDPADTPPIGSAAETIVITFPDTGATTWTFSGFMTGFEPSVPQDGRATASCTIKVSGAVTIE